ncbi:MAG TPA: DUF2079 domain-containing protein [Phycisphaerae bacterium]|nr:DUF2079 domain-containing protein [Phycisphaerae bacterium]
MSTSVESANRHTTSWAVVYSVVSGIILVLGMCVLDGVLFNVVTYEPIQIDVPRVSTTKIPWMFALMVLGAPSLMRWQVLEKPERATLEALRPVHIIWPVLGLIALVWLKVSPSYLGASLLFVSLGAAAAVSVAVKNTNESPEFETGDYFADAFGRLSGFGLVLGLVLWSTAWHAEMQYSFWQRYMLGYADMGLFVNELEHCLPWREASQRFADTRLGYHAVWMFYLLTPLYALVRHPVFLMVVGPLFLNAAAIPFFLMVKRRGGGSGRAILVACCWLLLPSLSRLPYAGTYGFQSIYLAVPFLAWTWCLAMCDRWKASHVCLVLAVLCEETVCGVAVGWGAYLLLFTKRRRDGVIIVVGAVAYLLLTTQVIIPHFTSAMTYTRLKLFGDVGVDEVAGRLARPEAAYYLVALLAPVAIGLWRHAKLLVVILPTLVLVLLLRDEQYLNIKYWHQSSMLPLIFCAATLAVVGEKPGASPAPRPDASRGLASGLFFTLLLFHQALGFSPIAQAERLQAAAPPPAEVDPRAQAVAFVHVNFQPREHTILASERIAAHVWEYRAIYPLAVVDSLDDAAWPDVVVVDAHDRWDPVIAADRVDEVLSKANALGYTISARFGDVFVMTQGNLAPANSQ